MPPEVEASSSKNGTLHASREAMDDDTVSKPLREQEPESDLCRHALRRCDTLALVALDAEGRVTQWNRGAERIYRYTAEEALGRPVTFLCRAEDIHRGEPANDLRLA